MWDFLDEALGTELGQIIAKGGKTVIVGRCVEGFERVWIKLLGFEFTSGRNVREAYKGVHKGQLTGMIEFETRNALAVGKDGSLGEFP